MNQQERYKKFLQKHENARAEVKSRTSLVERLQEEIGALESGMIESAHTHIQPKIYQIR